MLQRLREEIGSPVFGWHSWGCPTATVSQCWQLWPWYSASLSCRAGLQQQAGSSTRRDGCLGQGTGAKLLQQLGNCLCCRECCLSFPLSLPCANKHSSSPCLLGNVLRATLTCVVSAVLAPCSSIPTAPKHPGEPCLSLPWLLLLRAVGQGSIPLRLEGFP